MNPATIQALPFLAVALAVMCLGMALYEGVFRYRVAMRGRFAELLEQRTGSPQDALLFKDLSRLGQDEFGGSRSFREWLGDLLEQAGAPCSLSTLVAASGIAAALAGALGFFTVGVAGLGLAPFGGLAPLGVLYSRRHSRRRRLCQQLPETFQMISRAVRAGQTIPAALQIIAEDFEAPVRSEFALCYEQQNLGMSRESALRGLARRTGIMELRIFVVALIVQSHAGGDLVELLDGLANMVRKRLALWERVRALTGEGRLQAMILMVLPTAALAFLALTAPEYSGLLLGRPWLLALAAMMQALGMMWIRSIVNFEA
jgi:tight adherence protein B